MSGAFYNRQSTNGKENDFAMRLALLAGLLFFMRYPLAVYAKTVRAFLLCAMPRAGLPPCLPACGLCPPLLPASSHSAAAARWCDGGEQDLSFLPAYEEPQGTNYEWLRATSSTPGGANTTCTYTGTGQGHLAWCER
jgi:hypothetical protein